MKILPPRWNGTVYNSWIPRWNGTVTGYGAADWIPPPDYEYGPPENEYGPPENEYEPPSFSAQYDWSKIFNSVRIMTVVIYSVVCVLGVLGNGVVIWATGFRMEKTVSTVWYLNLAVADFLVTAFLPLVIAENVLDFYSPFSFFMCKLDGLVFYMNMYASVFTLVLISVYNCLRLACPVWTRNHHTVRKASWVSLGVWVLALALSIPYFIFRSLKPPPSYGAGGHLCYDTTIGKPINFIVGFVVPFSVIVSCYSYIIYRFRNNRSLTSQSGRSFKVIAAVIAVFFLCWIPFHIIRLIYVCLEMDLIQNSVTLNLVLNFGYPITRALALLNSCLNPLLYVVSQGFKDVFSCRSILKVLEKALAEEPPQTNNTPTDPDVTQMLPPPSGLGV